MITLQLTKEEAELLADVLDFWDGEMDTATQETIDTAPVDTIEDLFDLVDGMKEQKQMVHSLRTKVSEARGYSGS